MSYNNWNFGSSSPGNGNNSRRDNNATQQQSNDFVPLDNSSPINNYQQNNKPWYNNSNNWRDKRYSYNNRNPHQRQPYNNRNFSPYNNRGGFKHKKNFHNNQKFDIDSYLDLNSFLEDPWRHLLYKNTRDEVTKVETQVEAEVLSNSQGTAEGSSIENLSQELDRSNMESVANDTTLSSDLEQSQETDKRQQEPVSSGD